MELDVRALFRPGSAHTSGWRRMPAIAGDSMIATSHPLATAAGLEAFSTGGNAVDAALAAATVLAVAEPTDNGLGGDAFAQVWHGDTLHGLNGSGRSPRTLDEVRVDATGPRSVTVPGAVRGLGGSRGALRHVRARSAARPRGRPRSTRRRLHRADRREVGGESPTPFPAPPDRRAVRDPRPRGDARAPRRGRAGRVLRGIARRRDRRLLLALGGRPRGARVRMGRAPALRLPRRRGVRAAAQRPRARLRSSRSRSTTASSRASTRSSRR